jgi:hypothetical protein
LQDQNFLDAISFGTGDLRKVFERFSAVDTLIKGVLAGCGLSHFSDAA